MSTQGARQQAIADALAAAPLDERIRFAELIRAGYVARIANTQMKLDPKRLRAIDDGIAALKAQRQ